MARKMFVNLPVKDLSRSMEFFRQLGFEFNLQFTDETAACMVISEENYAMLLTYPKFQEFIPSTISDATKQTEVLVALSCESREEVADLVQKALAAGGAFGPRHLAAVDQHHETGNPAHAEPLGQRALLVDVDLPQGIALGDQFLDHRVHAAAWSAPVGIEVQQHGLAEAGHGRHDDGSRERDHCVPSLVKDLPCYPYAGLE